MKIVLESGREVYLGSFTFQSTYGTFGFTQAENTEMNVSVNRRVFDDISCPLDWGKREVLKIKPDKVDFETKLKPTIYFVWLSSEPMNPKYNGSGLAVAWLDDLPGRRSIEEIIERGVKHIDWNKNAKDFNW